MEQAIRRGRVLREILKQERLEPLSVEFQLAWLVAVNEGLFDAVELGRIVSLLQALRQRVGASALRLDDDREQWLTMLRDWLGAPQAEDDGTLS